MLNFRLSLILLLACFAMIFLIQNVEAVDVRFLFWHIAVSRAIVIFIAFMLGFSELSTFYRAFKRWTGITPQQYRRQVTPAF